MFHGVHEGGGTEKEEIHCCALTSVIFGRIQYQIAIIIMREKRIQKSNFEYDLTQF